MKKHLKIFILIIIGLLFCKSHNLTAQPARTNTGQNLKLVVIDAEGNPIQNAAIWANGGSLKYSTSTDGTANLSSVKSGEILIEASDFEPLTIMYNMDTEMTVTLLKAPVFSGESDKIRLPYTMLPKRRVVGAVSDITSTDLERSNEIRPSSSLAGLASGLYVFKGSNEPGYSNTSIKIRGQSRGGSGDGPLLVVDGVPERDMDVINILDIESIEILKDATSKLMYGSIAANGVINVTTKSGIANKRIASVTVDYGVKTPTVMPKWLNSYDYATLYNEARENDGLEKAYSDEALASYQSGDSAIRYPNVDFYDELLKSNTRYHNINAQFLGGTSDHKYFVSLGYLGESGLEKVGKETVYDQFSLRAKLDYTLNPVLSAHLHINGYMQLWSSHNMSSSELFYQLSTHRPNEYPLYFSPHPNPDSLMLGWSSVVPVNLYGELALTGYTNTQQTAGQTDLELKFNLEKFVKGLRAKVGTSFDTYNTLGIGKTEEYPRFRPDSTKVGDWLKVADQSRKSNDFYRLFHTRASLDYANKFGSSEITSNLVFYYHKRVRRGSGQDYLNSNLAYRLNYAYDNKYIVEGTASLMGSGMFNEENRYGVFPAIGAAWVLSEENFISGVEFINFLKLKGSFGILGYDRSMDFLWWKDSYGGDGSVAFGRDNDQSRSTWAIQQAGNPDLTFEKSREINLGIEGLFLNQTLFVEANIFDEFRYDMPVQDVTLYPFYLGSVLPHINYEEIRNKGVEVSAVYSNNAGAFHYSLGGSITSSQAEYVTVSELNPYPWMDMEGTATDAIRGYNSERFYMDEADITSHNVRSSLGSLAPGDLKFTDLNEDGTIDEFDREIIGNYFPDLLYSLNLKLGYKGIELFVLGQGLSGLDATPGTNYYRIYGERKYSEEALGRWTESTASSATYPRLTTSTNAHSMSNSTFWLLDGAYFKIRNIELSYTLPENISSKFYVSKMKIFTKGTDLFTFSKVEASDPEDFGAGIYNAPLFRTVSGGIKLTF